MLKCILKWGGGTHRLDFSNSKNILTAEINTSGEVYVYHNSSKKLYAANLCAIIYPQIRETIIRKSQINKVLINTLFFIEIP